MAKPKKPASNSPKNTRVTVKSTSGATVVLNRRIHADAFLPDGLKVEDKGEPPMMMRARDLWVNFMRSIPKGKSFAVPVKKQHVVSGPKQLLRKEGYEFVARTLHEDNVDVCRFYRMK